MGDDAWFKSTRRTFLILGVTLWKKIIVVNGTWLMYSNYSDCGYEEIKQEVLDSGKVIYHRRITQMGREFILGLFEKTA